MNGAQAILESLRREEVDIVFGYPGGAVLDLYDAVYQAKFPHILTRHEQGAVHAADGYARATGKVGVCFATSGPGATNLITGIATANMDSIPMVCFTGQVGNPYIGKDSFQEADIVGITTPITKHNYLVKKVEQLPRIIKEAFFIARTGRPGPVVIDIAKDVFSTQFEYEYPKTVNLRGYSGEFTGNEEEIVAAVEAIKNAKRPLFFIGGGMTLSGQSKLFREVVKMSSIPVICSLMGLGCVPSTDEGFLGMVGMHGSYAANMAVQECDLLITLGARFDDRVTGKLSAFAPNAKIVHFEVDKAEINKNVPVDYPVFGDLRWSMPIFLNLMIRSVDDFESHIAEWRNHVIAMNKEHPFSYKQNAETILPQQLIEKVSDLVDDDTIVVTDVGQHQMWAAQFFNSRKPRQFLTSGGLGTMGYGLPAAIGATLGAPQRTICLFVGDGGLQMSIQEFGTIMEHHMPVKMILLNNNYLGNVRQWQDMFFNGRKSFTRMLNPVYQHICQGYGIDYRFVMEREDLADAVREMLLTEGPFLLECAVREEDNILPMVPPGKAVDEMLLEI